ncbi:MAG: phage portal protein [Actinomycetota bacterium]
MRIQVGRFSLEMRSHPSNPDARLLEILGYAPSASGKSVTVSSAMAHAAFSAGIRVLSEDIASLPVITYRRLKPRGKERAYDHPLYPILHDQPNPEMDAFVFQQLKITHLNLWGNFYAQIIWGRDGYPAQLWPLMPDRMEVRRIGGELTYFYQKDPATTTYVDPRTGEKVIADPKTSIVPLPAANVFHVKGLSYNGLIGISPIGLAREALGLSIAAEEYGARFFANDARPGGYLETPEALSDEAYERLKKSWKESHEGSEKAHTFDILEEGTKFQEVGMPPGDAQFIDTRRFQLEEIARILRIPPHLLQDLERATFSNIEHQSINYVVYSIRPWARRDEMAILTQLVPKEQRTQIFAELLVDGLLRGDTVSRYTAYAQARNAGWMSADDICEIENRNPLPDGQGNIYLVPLNMVSAADLANPPPPKASPSAGRDVRNIRAMTPDDWEEQYKEGAAHWATDLTPSLFAQEYVEKLKDEGVNGKLLEIGCGNGRDSIFFARAGFTVTAIDVAPSAIKLAKDNAKEAEVDINFQAANAEDLPFEDGSFNALFSLSTLHASNLARSIPETARVLVNGGLMLVYIYGNTESVDSSIEFYTTADDFINLLKASGYEILDFYSEQEDEYDEAGEKHQILVALVRKAGA